ncbi:hypothetical protein [Thiolapillus sp.]|uniref:hypothetical protein n=1 Tax=Thiolapillus sp. TaxID=2017437 RepID=UPI003AF6EB9A
MKILSLLILTLYLSVSHAKTNEGQICMHIPGRGLETDKIAETCQRGDLILLNERYMPYLCDFNFAVTGYANNKYVCVYLGHSRKLKEGTSY